MQAKADTKTQIDASLNVPRNTFYVPRAKSEAYDQLLSKKTMEQQSQLKEVINPP
jgi:hypothetical protein